MYSRRSRAMRRLAPFVLAVGACSGGATESPDAATTFPDAAAQPDAVVTAIDDDDNNQRETDQPLVGLPRTGIDLFNRGDKIFESTFTVADGLGPLYIRASCAAC